jgi:hypothetical protein
VVEFMDFFAHVSARRFENVKFVKEVGCEAGSLKILASLLRRSDVRRAVSKFSRVCWFCWRMPSIDTATSLLLLCSALPVARIVRGRQW